jgi:hypothetical protein
LNGQRTSGPTDRDDSALSARKQNGILSKVPGGELYRERGNADKSGKTQKSH